MNMHLKKKKVNQIKYLYSWNYKIHIMSFVRFPSNFFQINSFWHSIYFVLAYSLFHRHCSTEKNPNESKSWLALKCAFTKWELRFFSIDIYCCQRLCIWKFWRSFGHIFHQQLQAKLSFV